jgi:hypothetical protein
MTITMSTQTITRLLLVSFIVSLISPAAHARSASWSERMAATVMTVWKNSGQMIRRAPSAGAMNRASLSRDGGCLVKFW